MKNNILDIVILNYKNYEDTIECIDSITNSSYKEFRIIVVDNHSNNGSVKKIRNYLSNNLNFKKNFFELDNSEISNYDMNNYSSNCYFIKSDSNLGYGGGNNLGIKLSLKLKDSKYIWVLNNDTIVDENSILNQVKKMDDSRYLMCGSKIYYYNTNQLQCHAGASFNNIFMTSKYITGLNIDEFSVEKQLDYISGASIFFNKEYFKEYGLFDERFFLYFEEIDLVKRVNNKKNFLAYSSKSIIYHKEGASIGSSSDLNSKSLVSEYNSFRSRIQFTKKHFIYQLPFVYILGIVYILHRLIHGKLRLAKEIARALLKS